MAYNNQLLSLVLLGKTGQGKSSTGNSLLGTYRFEEGDNLMSETKVVVNYTMNHKGYKVKVFDTPGYFDVESKGYENVKYSLTNVETLMKISKDRSEVIDAFLLVISCQERFSSEDKKTIEAYENTFGKEFLTKHCIIVITKGDCLDVAFDEWLGRQRGDFPDVLNKCEKRVLLVSNKDIKKNNTANEFNEGPRLKTREDIMHAVLAMKRKNPKGYSYEDYSLYADSRNKLLLKSELETLIPHYSQKLSEITVKRSRLEKVSERDSLLQEIAVLKFTIQEKDNGTGLLQNQLNTLAHEERLVSQVSFSSCAIS